MGVIGARQTCTEGWFKFGRITADSGSVPLRLAVRTQKRLRAIVNAIVPPSLRGSVEARQARLLIGLVLLIELTVLPNGVVGSDGHPVLIALALLIGLMLALPIAVLRTTGSVFWAGNTYGVLALIGSLGAIYYRGLDSSTALYLVLPAAVTTVVASPRSGAFWGSVSIALGSAMAVLQARGTLPPSHPSTLLQVVTPLVVAGCYLIFTTAYSESTARRALRESRALNTELTRARDEARRVAETRARFLATMSHELRTPLNGVVGAVQLMRSSAREGDPSEHLATLDISSAALMAVVNDVLDLSKIEAGQLGVRPEPTHLAEVVERAVRVARAQLGGKPVDVTWTIDDAISPLVETDPMRLGQILTNLLGNAVKFTSQGTIAVEVTLQGDHLSLAIRDTGAGIPEDRLESIFEPFRQADERHERRYGGTGLGLPISRHLAKLLGGNLIVQSTVGQGSTFTATIAYVPSSRAVPSSAGAREQDSKPMADLRGRRILVVDDHPINRQVAAAMLRKLGAAAELAVDGRDAVSIWERDPTFDLILMDWEMPELNGGDATAAIRRLPGGDGVPVVAVTAHVMADFRQRCLDADLDDYLAKPLVVGDLARVVHLWASPENPRRHNSAGQRRAG